MAETPRPQDEPAGLLNAAIQRPVSVLAGVLLVVFFGVLAVTGLPIQLTPDIERPTITVTTDWPGASPVEVETDIIDEQEEELKNVQGLIEMESTANSNSGTITLEFRVGTDLDEAVVRVSNALNQVSSYPENVEQPRIRTANSSGPPLAVVIGSSMDGGTMAPYRTWMENEILPQIERIPGISGAYMRGGQVDEVHIDFKPEDLAARGLTVAMVVQRIQGELRNVSAGDVRIGKRRLLVRTMLAAELAPEMEQIVIGADADGVPIKLGDVARVTLGLRKATDVAQINDRPGIAMLFFRESGANVLEVTEQIIDLVERLDVEEFQPEGLRLQVVSDQSGYITDSLSQVRTNLLLGAGFAIIVLLLFLRSFGASAIISIAIPISALGTALGMAVLGRSVNVVSLAGVTFAIGMVVDASIVSLENIVTWRGRLTDPKRAAFYATKEVWGALLASTATTVVVFAPVITWDGEIGEILRDIAFAISIAVTLSFAVSVLVIPSLSVWLLGKQTAASEVERKPGPLKRFGQWTLDSIVWQVAFLGRGALRSALVVIVAVALAGVVAQVLLPKFEYLPEGNRNLVFGIILPPPGYSVESVEELANDVQSEMYARTGVEREGEPGIDRSFFVGDPSTIIAGGVALRNDGVGEMLQFMRQLHGQTPGAISFANQASLFGNGIGAGRAIEVEITGVDLNVMIPLAQQMYGAISQAIPGSQIRPIPLLDLGAPELQVRPRRDDTAGFGVVSPDLALLTNAYIDGAIIGEWGQEGDTKIDVVFRAINDEGDYAYETPEALSSAPVALNTGQVVPFGVLADIETALGPTVIQRLERRRAVILQVTPPIDVPLEGAIETVRNDVIAQFQAQSRIPEDVSINIGGTAGKLEVAKKQFIGILLIALIISFLLLAALFEDFLAPVVVLTVIPLAAAGGVIALQLVNAFLAPQPLDLISAIGFLILIGVVVNNAILIVDGALTRIRAGDSIDDAIAEAVRGRVRPIFMSTATSLAGLAPMIFVTGEGSELYRGVGTIVLGGLALSTVLALYVVPSFFTLLWRIRFWLSNKLAGAS